MYHHPNMENDATPWKYGKQLRELRGPLSVEKAARKVGVGRQSWVSWEAGKAIPRYDNLKAICEAFDCPPEMIGLEAPEGWELVPRDWLIKEFECLHAKLNQVDDCFKAMKKDAS